MSRHSGEPQQPDWLMLAEHVDHHLTLDNPIWLTTEPTDEPTPLEVHIHKGMDVIVMLSGGCEVVYGDLALSAEQGDVFLVAMWEPHAWRFTACHNRMVVFCFLPEMLETELCPELSLLGMFTLPPSERPRVTAPETRSFILSVAEEVISEHEQRPLGYLVNLHHHLLRLLIALRREWKPLSSPLSWGRINANYIERIQPAITLAHSRPMRVVRAKEAAATCGLGLSRFHQVFTQTMGISYGDFCLRARLAFAGHLLLSTNLPVDAIAREAGFNDGSHLHHRFVARYSHTPSEYRKQGQETPRPGLRTKA